MKKINLTMVMIIIAITVFAQAPQAFKYQAVARDNAGNVLDNQNVTFRFSILQGSASGTLIFLETHETITNEFGLVNLEVGNGVLVSGDFSTISWGDDSYFLQIEMDEAGGTNYQLMGTSQLLSVPYALYSETTANPDDGDWTISGNNMYSSVSGNVGIGTSDPIKKMDLVGDIKVLGTASSGNTGIDLQIGSSVSGKGGKVMIKAGDAQNSWSSNHWGGDIEIKGGTGVNNSGGDILIEGGRTSIWTQSSLPVSVDIYGGGIDGAPDVLANSALITVEGGKQLGANSPNRSGGNIILNPGLGEGNGLAGNVGIGTTNPIEKLEVLGNIIADYPTNSNHVATKQYVDDQLTEYKNKIQELEAIIKKLNEKITELEN